MTRNVLSFLVADYNLLHYWRRGEHLCRMFQRERERGVSLYRKLLQQTRPERLLFTGQLGVEAGESNAEGLDCAHRVLVIHGEDVLGYPSELHNDVLIV